MEKCVCNAYWNARQTVYAVAVAVIPIGMPFQYASIYPFEMCMQRMDPSSSEFKVKLYSMHSTGHAQCEEFWIHFQSSNQMCHSATANSLFALFSFSGSRWMVSSVNTRTARVRLKCILHLKTCWSAVTIPKRLFYFPKARYMYIFDCRCCCYCCPYIGDVWKCTLCKRSPVALVVVVVCSLFHYLSLCRFVVLPLLIPLCMQSYTEHANIAHHALPNCRQRQQHRTRRIRHAHTHTHIARPHACRAVCCASSVELKQRPIQVL